MNSMLLASSNSVWNYVLIAVVALLLIAMPIMMNQRNKKETQKIQEQTNSLKVGDKVLTTSGVYGTITELKFDDSKKVVVIETGGKVKSYMSVDAYSIYTVFKSDAELAREAELKAEEEKKKEEEEAEKKAQKKSKNKSLEEEVAEVSAGAGEEAEVSEVKSEKTEETKAEEKTEQKSKKSTKKNKK